MKFSIQMFFGSALALALLGGCGHDWYYGGDSATGTGTNTGSGSFGDRKAEQSGLVRYQESELSAGTTFDAHGGTLVVHFHLPGRPVPKNLSVEYATSSYFDSSHPVVRPLTCTVTKDDAANGDREFTCVLASTHDEYDSKTFYLNDLKFTCDGMSGTFDFHQKCSASNCFDSSVSIWGLSAPSLYPE